MRLLRAPTTVALVATLLVGGGSAAAQRSAHPRPERSHESPCRVPRLNDLTVVIARERSAKAGCHIRVLGAPLESPQIQTIRRQNARPGQLRRTVTVWVNPICWGSSALGPRKREPILTPGPSELVSGLYLVGGPSRHWSAPNCDSLVGTPGAGTITVTDPASGVVVASATVGDGQLARLALPPGTYTVVGAYAHAFTDTQHIQSRPQSVAIPAQTTVRQDVSVDIP